MKEKTKAARLVKKGVALAAVLLLIFAGAAILFNSSLREKLLWKATEVEAYARGALLPKSGVPGVAGGKDAAGSFAYDSNATDGQAIEEPSGASAEPFPQEVTLTAPAFDLKKDIQDWNNCGPATLALGLRMFGWKGDQYDIADVIKPDQTDKNVNASEMADYVARAGLGVSVTIRVNSTDEQVMKLLAAGIPVIIEESFKLEESFWPGDDLWAAHYLLITGYDLSKHVWIVQDSFYGPNRKIGMDLLAQTWKSFNRLVFILYKTQDEAKVIKALGANWDTAANLQAAVLRANDEISVNPKDSFAWFNLGESLLGLQEYGGAASAFAHAREIGLPQRMLRYQFGPLEAAYKIGNIDDLFLLANYALDRTPNSEEALTWKGYAYILSGQTEYARKSFERALEAHPRYAEAEEGLSSLQSR